jgi:hypothetical protein
MSCVSVTYCLNPWTDLFKIRLGRFLLKVVWKLNISLIDLQKKTLYLRPQLYKQATNKVDKLERTSLEIL